VGIFSEVSTGHAGFVKASGGNFPALSSTPAGHAENAGRENQAFVARLARMVNWAVLPGSLMY
jgi:hypothetical protein